jgi:hypothetical protein
MADRTWLRRAALVLLGILAATTAPQAVAQTKDKIPVNPKLLVDPPKGAIVLFSGKPQEMRDNWYTRRSTDPARWTVDAKGVATPDRKDISSKQEFGDCYVHVEFCEPQTTTGNSGVGLEGRYEIQILNSYGRKPECHECGAVYSEVPPLVMASKPAGQWQTYDIFFRAPRFDEAGKVVERPRVTAYQNGLLIQKDTEIPGPTGIQYEQYKDEVPKGPLVLQGDHDPVQFRKVWVLPASY